MMAAKKRKTGKATERSGSSSTRGAGGAARVRPKKKRTDMGVRREGKATKRKST